VATAHVTVPEGLLLRLLAVDYHLDVLDTLRANALPSATTLRRT